MLTIELVDAGGNTVLDFSGDKNFTFSGLSAADDGTQPTVAGQPITNATISLTFTDGASTATLIAYKSETNVTLNAHDDAGTPLSTTSTGGSGLTLTVSNANPVAPDRGFARAPLTSYKIAITNLTGSVTDDNKDIITLDSVSSASSTVATVTKGTAYVFYTPNGVTGTDTFTYTVSDGHGGTGQGTVTINVVTPGGIVNVVPVSGGTASIKLYGIPGVSYDIQRTINLINWTTLTPASSIIR